MRFRRTFQTRWLDTLVDITITPSSQLREALDIGLPGSQKKGVSLLRTLLDLTFRATTLGTYPEAMGGIVMVKGDADAAGAVPDPGDVADQPGWVTRYHRKATDANAEPLIRLQQDIRTSRKYLGANDTLLIIHDNISAASGNIIITGLVRALIRIP